MVEKGGGGVIVGEKKDEPISSGLKMVAIRLGGQFCGNDNKRRRW